MVKLNVPKLKGLKKKVIHIYLPKKSTKSWQTWLGLCRPWASCCCVAMQMDEEALYPSALL